MEAPVTEVFIADRLYRPGTLLKVGGPQEVTQTTHDGDTGIVGVVLNVWSSSDVSLTVGLVGRLHVRVAGSVKKGDALIPSDLAGVARSIGKLGTFVEDLNHIYSVIGIALEDKTSQQEAVVLALIGKN
jgi:hypothetical protein